MLQTTILSHLVTLSLLQCFKPEKAASFPLSHLQGSPAWVERWDKDTEGGKKKSQLPWLSSGEAEGNFRTDRCGQGQL
jgi:hypothetical protein